MKHFNVQLAVALSLFSFGCSKPEETVVAPPPPAPQAVSMATTPAAPAPTPDTPPPTAAGAAIMPAAQDAEVKIADAEGKPVPILDFMNTAVEGYERTRAGMTEGVIWPPLTSLEIMVQVGYMKKLPAAPSGQKFHLNPETKKVTLVPQ